MGGTPMIRRTSSGKQIALGYPLYAGDHNDSLPVAGTETPIDTVLDLHMDQEPTASPLLVFSLCVAA